MTRAPRPAVLVITPRFPYPAIGGDLLRIYSIIEHLSADFDVDVFSLYGSDAELAGLAGLRAVSREVHTHRLSNAAKLRRTATGWLRGMPLQVAMYYDRAAALRIEELFRRRRHDVVLSHLVRTAQYTRNLPQDRVVLELTDAISMNYHRIGRPRTPLEMVYVAERSRLLKYEVASSRRAAHAVVVSAADRGFLVDRGAPADIAVITNGTDVRARPGVAPKPGTVAFLGNLRSAPNEDMALRFACDVLPLVREQRPDTTFLVIGANPTKRVRRLHDGTSVIVTGAVPDSGEVLAGAWVSVCPMRFGAGVQNKILESMALGVPVVTTSAGLEGIPAVPGRDVLLAEDDEGLAREVLRLLADPDLRDAVGASGRAFIEAGYRWDTPMRRYADLLRGARDDD